MAGQPRAVDPVTLEAMRRMPLFERFSQEQLAWLAGSARLVDFDAGECVFEQGDPIDFFWVLVHGQLRVFVPTGGRMTLVAESDTPGSWSGDTTLLNTRQRVRSEVGPPSTLLRVPAAVLEEMLTTGFPLAHHLISGYATGGQEFAARTRQHEKLTSLGRLAAGLAHEVNNPAAAASRAVAQLRASLTEERVAGLRLEAGLLGLLVPLVDDLAETDGGAHLDPLARSEREDELADVLADAGVDDAEELAATLVESGADVYWLERLVTRVPERELPVAVRWVAANASSARLAEEIEQSLTRISEVVRAVKVYSFMDRGEMQDVDVRAGITSTLAMLRHRLRQGVTVERDDDPGLPLVAARGAELNQVWTNLVDNAVDAMDGVGTLRIVTRHEGGDVVVTVTDSGAGIPEEVRPHIFDPFFTTKEVGSGTGLGLDTVYRIVVQGHGGSVDVTSRPGATTFTVCLPVAGPPLSPGTG